MGKKLFWGLVAVTGVAFASALGACSETPTSVPQRTFDRAQKMDVVCMQVLQPDAQNPSLLVPVKPVRPLPQENCAPVPSNVDGSLFLNQLFAVVTQTARGEVAVVNLSSGEIVDQQKAIPSINFIPVGAIPTDVATTPDGQMVFVASAEVNKPAIYGIPSTSLLGDNPDFATKPAGTLAAWPVCSLPQNPGALTIVPRPNPSGVKGPADYEVVAILPGSRLDSAKVVTIDPKPFLRGADAFQSIAAAGLGTLEPGDTIAPGSLAPCPITSAIELVGASNLPSSFVTGPNWPDGVPYVDGGVDLTCQRPLPAASCGQAVPCCESTPTVELPFEGGIPNAAAPDGGAPDSGAACQPVTPTPPANVTLNVGSLDPPRLVAVARNDQVLYVSDDTVPFIHVVDLSTVGALKEISPLLATSLLNPSRQVSVADITVSPATHDFKRYLYAVDKFDGSLIVYDVTDPLSTQRSPLTRPNPELNPFQPPDRIAFPSPVVAVAFARHDFPLSLAGNIALPDAKTGVLCNPNPNVANAITPGQPAPDFGFYYRADQNQNESLTQFTLGPTRLRGIFGFATLANGQVIAIDVDDWDAPCRRPVTIGPNPIDPEPWALAIPEPAATSTTFFDPYHVPTADPATAVSQEAYFPVSAPHRLRSSVLLNNTSSTGNHLPRFQTAPIVSTKDIPLPTTGADSDRTPRLNLLFSLDVPESQIDQAWALTYEGAIPGFDGLTANLVTADSYQSLDFSQSQGQFCAKGVEDWTQGAQRADAINAALTAPDRDLFRRLADYVTFTEDLLDSSDPYWGLQEPEEDKCWDPQYQTAQQRFDVCSQTFGAAADESELRDYPILEAFDGKLVVGRFFRPAPITLPNGSTIQAPRQIVGRDPSNVPFLKLARCCFHRQARFHVRTGGIWSAVATGTTGGPGIGFLNHMTAASDSRCVSSCDSRESLLNGRLPAVPFDAFPAPAGGNPTVISRDSALAMRNPMFSANIINPTSGTLPVRDTVFKFSTAGQFSPLFINIGSTTTSINPQSIRYIEPLGQLAVVDAASQGLVLIDLDNVTIAHAPYF
ncbi:hypothetical protein [Labilithrix luteola]|nr:hypothetical protein [Labilithrix luteola]